MKLKVIKGDKYFIAIGQINGRWECGGVCTAKDEAVQHLEVTTGTVSGGARQVRVLELALPEVEEQTVKTYKVKAK